MGQWGLLITCEHASAAVPASYRHLFAVAKSVLRTHRGYDIGALDVATRMGHELGTAVVAGAFTRLLVDLNRSRHHPGVFSEYTRGLSKRERAALLATYHSPHRAAVDVQLEALWRSHSTVLHLAIHSFTPELEGHVRNADLGLLYDPRRALERELARKWQLKLAERAPGLRVRRNYPYRGTADGLPTSLRKVHGPRRYLGFEIELNQAGLQRPALRAQLATLLATTLPQESKAASATMPTRSPRPVSP